LQTGGRRLAGRDESDRQMHLDVPLAKKGRVPRGGGDTRSGSRESKGGPKPGEVFLIPLSQFVAAVKTHLLLGGQAGHRRWAIEPLVKLFGA
jgi:hypothetical protein